MAEQELEQPEPRRPRRRRRGGGRGIPSAEVETDHEPTADDAAGGLESATAALPSRHMVVRVRPQRTQIAVIEGRTLIEHYSARSEQSSIVGNICLGKVQNVLPGMEAAFVDIGTSKNGVLYVGDVQYDEDDLEGNGRPRIEQVLTRGQHVMVQVTKDAMGSKGARLTAQLSVPGRFLVLVPDSSIMGISRRLPDTERERLRQLARQVRPEGFGIIIRTAAEGASEEAVRDDLQRLVARWGEIEEAGSHGPAPRLIYQEPEMVMRVIREIFGPDFKRLSIDDDVTYRKVLAWLDTYAPDMKEKVVLYDDPKLGLFERYHVSDQIRKALDRKVWLPSGGHIVIDRTEALTVIDVNTGKFVGQDNLEETVFRNNLEAAQEISRQLRLRDIGGIVVIDFIDMEVRKNRKQVVQAFKECLARDKTRTQVFDISRLGLLEMTRKNVSAGLLETFSDACPSCGGRGIVVDDDLD